MSESKNFNCVVRKRLELSRFSGMIHDYHTLGKPGGKTGDWDNQYLSV